MSYHEGHLNTQTLHNRSIVGASIAYNAIEGEVACWVFVASFISRHTAHDTVPKMLGNFDPVQGCTST